jgi:AcrR family transcriptional regulator
MPRPKAIHDDQILDAARAVFLERGFGATTAEVARRAGCAEGSIFNRFPTKTGLFQAAMEPRPSELRWISDLAEPAGQPGLSERLLAAGLEAMDYFRAWLPAMMMTWSHPDARCEMASRHGAGPRAALRRLTRIFATETSVRALPAADPEMLAHFFLGSLSHYAFVEMTGERTQLAPVPFVRALIAQLLR